MTVDRTTMTHGWIHEDTMRGEEWRRGVWLVLRSRGDRIWNVFSGAELRAIGFETSLAGQAYVNDRLREGESLYKHAWKNKEGTGIET